jgi:hypothetical protein
MICNMAGGRPSKLPVAEERILEDIRAGCYPEQAAQAAGVSPSTLYAWKAKGEKESDGPYRRFLLRLRQAEAEAELKAVKVMRSAIEDDGDWKAALAFLERRFPGRWRRQQTNELVGPGGGPLLAEQLSRLDVSKLSDAELELMRTLYERALSEPEA